MITTLCSSIAQAGETEDERVQNMANYLVDYAQRCMSSTRATPFERAFLKFHSSLLFVVGLQFICNMN